MCRSVQFLDATTDKAGGDPVSGDPIIDLENVAICEMTFSVIGPVRTIYRLSVIHDESIMALRKRKGMTKSGLSAFSLVELVIVIVIIGIIAAVAIPRFSRSQTGAGDQALAANLRILRSAIDKYAAEHAGVNPGAKTDGGSGAANSEAAFVSQLTKFSSEAGVTSDTRTSEFKFGPYLLKIPTLPVSGKRGRRTVAIDTTNSPPLVTGGAEAWIYNPTTGEIIANTDDANATGMRAYDEY